MRPWFEAGEETIRPVQASSVHQRYHSEAGSYSTGETCSVHGHGLACSQTQKGLIWHSTLPGRMAFTLKRRMPAKLEA